MERLHAKMERLQKIENEVMSLDKSQLGGDSEYITIIEYSRRTFGGAIELCQLKFNCGSFPSTWSLF